MPQEETKKKKRKAYLNDFEKNHSGDYVYKGTMYFYEGDDLKQKLLRLWAMGLLILLLVAIVGMIESPGTINCFYVIIPYLGVFLAAVSVVWAIVRTTIGRNPIRSYVFEASFAKINDRCIYVMICSVASEICELVYVIRNGFEGNLFAGILFLLFMPIAFGVAYCLRQYVQKIPWAKQESEREKTEKDLNTAKDAAFETVDEEEPSSDGK